MFMKPQTRHEKIKFSGVSREPTENVVKALENALELLREHPEQHELDRPDVLLEPV